MIGQPLDRLLPDEMRHVHDGHIAGFIGSGVERRAMSPARQMMGCRRDGSRFPLDSTISRAMMDGQLQLTAALRDVTERERAKANLQQANEQLRMLADALQDVREAERIRIARELHDDLGQRLTGLRLDLSWLSDKLKKEGSDLAQDVDATRANLDSAMAGARRIWTELQPVMIDDLGFSDAVYAMARETSRHSGIEISTEMPARATMSKGPVATALFRVVQEAVNNLVRHAGATRATVGLVMVGEDLVLTVSDNGVGFNVNARVGKGLGLVSMRERVLALAGTFDIDSGPGRGTVIRITIPLAVLARDEALEHDEEPT
jgi:signal transduction histidine kinase